MPRMMDRGMMDMRNAYGSEGGYVTSRRRGRRRGRRDRGMMEDYGDYEMDMARGRGRGRDRAGDYADMAGGSDYARGDYARGRDYGDYEGGDVARGGRGRDRGEDYGDYESDMARRGRGGRDGHYPMGQGSTYYPIEAMGRFNGYWGMPEEDYGYDMARGGRGGNRGGGRGRGDRGDYGYDYGYDYGGDYGEGLTKEELEHWKKKLMKEVEEKDKQFFGKENVEQKAKQLGIEMEKFNAEELAVATAAMYTDYSKALKPYIGANMDVYVKMGEAFLNDKDASVKGGEKLAVYFDCIVEGEED